MKRALLPRCGAGLALLAGLSWCTGCLVAAAGAGVVLSQEALPNQAQLAEVALDVDLCWTSVQHSLRELGARDLVTQDYPRRVRGHWEGYDIAVHVEAYDLERTRIRVEAYRFLSTEGPKAGELLERLLEDLGALAR